MAIFSVIDTGASGDTFYEGMVKDAANWALAETQITNLKAGLTTQILVGGGAATTPVWTTATGTGAPVRAGSPTFTGTVTAPIIKLTTGAGASKLLTSDATGIGSWTDGRLVQIQYSVVNTVVSGSTVLPLDNTVPQITEGFELDTCAITPTSATNELLIIAHAMCAARDAGYVSIALFQDATASALAALSNSTGQSSIFYQMTAGTTSETTFRLRGGASAAGSTYFGGQFNTNGTAVFNGVQTSIGIFIIEYNNP